MKKFIAFLLSITYISISGCKTAYETTAPLKGSADFSVYVAVGNSLTAGYADGALYKSGQQSSYPSMLAQQFKLAGGGDFKQPLMFDDNGVGFSGTTPITKRVLALVTDCKGTTSLSPKLASSTVNSDNYLTMIGSSGPYNNMGVPGAKSYHILSPLLSNPTYGNPYYVRMASVPGTSYVLAEAVAQKPTFFTFWLGSNDVLLYATGGGEGASDTVTSPSVVSYAINTALTALTANGAKGAIANVPDITSIPHFTTVPYNGLTLDATSATQLTSAYSALGITFQAGSNAFIIADASAIGGLRKIKSTEYILISIPQDSIKCAGWGSTKPIPGKYVLTEAEVTKIQDATTAYNSTIATLASTYGLALVDMNQKLKDLKSGLVYNGINYTTTFVTGGAFSLDGIHLTPQGYAIVANTYIDAINAKYGSTLPYVNITSYSGIVFP